MSGEQDFRTVADLGEALLVARITGRIGSPAGGEVWAGDDAAVLRWQSDRLICTIDALTENVDFDLAYCSGADAGFKAIAANASDIASMGARPKHAVCALTLPPSTAVTIVDSLVEGMVEAAACWDISLVGGDVGRAGEISLTVAMTGEPLPGGPVLRSGARRGDVVCVTGTLGGAAGGLAVLRAGITGDWAARLARHQLRPTARVVEAALLSEIGVTAMIDVSDGLATDAARLCRASDAGCEIDTSALPVHPDLDSLHGADPVSLAVNGGEDYELLCTMSPGNAGRARSSLEAAGTRLSVIGSVTETEVMIGGRAAADWGEGRWEHLRDP